MARPGSPIRVLVVDDSALARDMVSAILSCDPGLRVIGQAADGAEAVAMAAALKPDIVTMDIEMPVMDGLTAIERIMAASPIPILVVTSQTGVRTAFAAVSKGALDVVEKPDLDMANGVKLINKIKFLAAVDVVAHHKASSFAPGSGPAGAPGPARPSPEPAPAVLAAPAGAARAKRIVAIASSTGGPKALQQILASLPGAFPVPVVVSQHVASGFANGMAEWLNSGTPLQVSTAREGDVLAPGRVYLNPSDFSMRITARETVQLCAETAGQTYHPSCDAMLESVAAVYGREAVGAILTGMGDDGVAGMRAIKAAGGATLAQDEHSSIVFGMNGVAVKQGCIDQVLPLHEFPAELLRLVATKVR
jgi:two-component system chemotaxis response regulator CheB